MKQALTALFRPAATKLPKPPKRYGIAAGGADSPGFDPVQNYYELMRLDYERRKNYELFDELDELEDIAAVLDAIAEESTQTDPSSGLVVQVKGRDRETVKEVQKLFERLEVEEWASPCIRDTTKRGDDFARLIYDPDNKDGVVGVDWSHPMFVERDEDEFGMLLGFLLTDQQISNERTREDMRSEPWDFVHFRRRKSKLTPEGIRQMYGTSLLWRASRPGRRVSQLRDLMMLYRITKTMDTRIFKIDIGQANSPEEALDMLRRWRRALKRRVFRNPQTGEYKVDYDPVGAYEDIYWPTSQNSASAVDVIQGNPDVNSMVDIDHHIASLYGSMRVPPGYFGYEIGPSASSLVTSKGLGYQDIRFGRTCGYAQRCFRQGLARIAQIHLAMRKMDTDLRNFEIVMVPTSNLEELQRLEMMQTVVDVAERKAGLADALGLDKKLWAEKILREVLGLSRAEVKKLVVVEPPEGGEGDFPPFARPGAPEEPEGEGEEDEEPQEESRERLLERLLSARPRELPEL